jgi:hypothetical protein
MMLSRMLLIALAAAVAFAEENAAYTFGTTVVDSSGLQGRVYHLDSKTEELPKLSRMSPVGTIYTLSLNVWPQSFDQGFPSITDRFEWFAIEYTGKFWIEKPGQYRFSLLADDGSKLFINHKLVINNDGVHRAEAISAAAALTRGVHDIRIEYFQGPRFTVALVLAIAPPGEPWRIFHMHDFKPPKDPEEWKEGRISGVTRQTIR